MMYITMTCKNIDGWYEDVYFSFWSHRLVGYHLPTKEVAATFSVETIFNRDPMGLHKPHLEFFTPDEVKDYNQLLRRPPILNGHPRDVDLPNRQS